MRWDRDTTWIWGFVILASTLGGGRAAAAPVIENLSLRGLQVGGKTTLSIGGADLEADSRIVLPIPIAEQKVVHADKANRRVDIEVALAAEVPAGTYPLRIANALGISNPVYLAVDSLPESAIGPETKTMPAALTGTISGNQTARTSFAAKKGERLLVEVLARRLGANFNPAVEIVDARRKLVRWSGGTAALTGDPRVEFDPPSDGVYTVEIHDAAYAAPSGSFFRLLLGNIAYADLAYPMGGRAGTTAVFELIGRLPAVKVEAALPSDAADAFMPAPLAAGAVGPAPPLGIGRRPEFLEGPRTKFDLPRVAPPIVINGRLDRPGEEDRYLVEVQPGTNLRVDLWAQRGGSLLDGVLAVSNEAGQPLAMGDDRPGTKDAGFDVAVPAGTHRLILSISDLERRGGPRFPYRISIDAANPPDYSLSVFDDRYQTPLAGTSLVRVRANRAGYNGPIRLFFHPLPSGLIVGNASIPAGATDALVSLSAFGLRPDQSVASIVGEAVDAPDLPPRVAQLPDAPVHQCQPWTRGELGVSVTGPARLGIHWEDAPPQLFLGRHETALVRVTRAAGVEGAVRLSLVTSQIVPKLPDGKDDVNQAIRLDGAAETAAEQSFALAKILAPANLPNIPYDVAIQAELLSKDGKGVVATATTPARRLTPRTPVEVQLVGAATVEGRSGEGPSGSLQGRITRWAGYSGPVTVTLAGLPPEILAPTTVVPPGKDEFALPISFPYGTKIGPLAGARLVARIESAPQQYLSSNEIPVSINVVQGTSPALYRVFEDESPFLALLSEGDGQASLEPADRYSGTGALKVTRIQKYRQKLPSLGYKIAEKPGDGEYRYLRFAWKKKGGNNILLQLGVNDGFGPMRGAKGPAYRYEAGPVENPFNVAAVRLDTKLPEDWVVVTRDLFADFGAFAFTGIAFTPGEGEYGLFDHVYLARSMDDFKGCPPPLSSEKPLAIFEDQTEFAAQLIEGDGKATIESVDRYSGTASVKVTPRQRFSGALPNLSAPIRKEPGPGEYRYLTFAWKKVGGGGICLQLNHDGKWGPIDDRRKSFRYHSGPAAPCFRAAKVLDMKLPSEWTVVVRDLYKDFGEFRLDGLSLTPIDGEYALFDHIYLGRTPKSFQSLVDRPLAAR